MTLLLAIKRNRRALVVLNVLTLAAETGCLGSEHDDDTALPQQHVDALRAKETRELRYIDYAPEYADKGCPSFSTSDDNRTDPWLGAWEGSTLFSKAELGPGVKDGIDANLPTRLRSYCVFRWRANPKRPDAYASFESTQKDPERARQQADRPIVSALEPISTANGDASFDDASLAGAIDDLTFLNWGLAGTLERLEAHATGKVRVALVDNGPFGSKGESAPHEAPHARAVANIIRAFGCPRGDGAGPCVIEQSAHLALPHIKPTATDYVHGGYFGTRSQLALAIWHSALTSPQRTVLNLSVGWVPDGGALSAPELAVHDALAFARCRGQLPIAAAGNRARLHDIGTGPLLPGGFERLPAPTDKECSTWFDIKKGDSKSGYEPLVFAAGALDPTDQPILATSEGGRPPLGAYGFLVRAQDTLPLATTYSIAPLTGSSMAAAALSGAASALWSIVPERDASSVMQLLYDSGLELGTNTGDGQADFNLAGARPTVHRISLCRALALALGEAPKDCKEPDAYAGAFPSLHSSHTVAESGSAAALSAAAEAAWAAGTLLDGVHTPSVGPQPTSPGCSTCKINSAPVGPSFAALGTPDAELQLALTPSVALTPGLQILLTLGAGPGAQTFAITPPADPSKAFVVEVPAPPGDEAMLTFIQPTPDGPVELFEQLLVQ